MMTLFGRTGCWAQLLIATILLASIDGATMRAAEPAQGFLQEMRRRGLNEVALEYLEAAKAHPENEPGLAPRIDFELGVTLFDLARQNEVDSQREALLERSAQSLAEFLQAHGDSADAGAANGQLAEIGILRGLSRLDMAERQTPAPEGDAVRQRLLGDAKQFLDEAGRALAAQRRIAETKAEQGQAAARRDPKTAIEHPRMQEALAAEAVAVQLHGAYVEQLKARLFAPASNEAKAQWRRAATAYRRVFDEHKKTSFAALEARAGEGRCLQMLGDVKGALAALEECLAAPDEPRSFRALKLRTLLYAGECWIDPAIRQPQLAIARVEEWLAARDAVAGEAAPIDDRGDAESGETELALQYVVARAKEMIAVDPANAAAKRAPIEISAERRRTLIEDALRGAIAAASSANVHRRDARELLDRLLLLTAKEHLEPHTFAAAKLRADAVVASMHAKMEDADNATGRRQASGTTPTRTDRAIAAAADDAIAGYRTALALLSATDESATSDVDAANDARHALCQLFYQRGRYRDAAMLGELLLTKYPTSRGAQHAALVALASRLELSGEGTQTEGASQDARAISAKAAALVEKIGATWPDAQSAYEANLLVATALIRRGELKRAETALRRLDDGPRTQRARLALGIRLADDAARQAQQPAESRQTAADLAALRHMARDQLQASIEPLAASGDIDVDLVRGALALAQMELNVERQPGDAVARDVAAGGKDRAVESGAARAIKILEAPGYGPWWLLEADRSLIQELSANQPGFAVATLDAALRAYVTAASSDLALLAKADAVLVRMPRLASAQQCLAVYARLPETFSNVLATTAADRRDSLAAGYSKLLTSLRDGAANKQAVLAIAMRGFEALANSTLTTDGKRAQGSEAAAKQFYRDAVSAGQQALAAPFASDGEAARAQATVVRATVARCAWRSGNYELAATMYRELLGSQELLVDVQADAARMLQQRGTESPEYLRAAIRGTVLGDAATGQATVEGWTRLAKIAAKNERLIGLFHEARYQMAVCYFELGKREHTAKGKSRRGGSLQTAKRAIEATYRNDPELGGTQRRADYERLVRGIQHELGETEIGLAEFGG
jgi:hypothetical protein